ncbi:MAG: polyprenol monophosphomannose synthase [Omnitrophica WOR_2 bacterium]
MLPVSIVLPTYCERDNIGILLKALDDCMAQQGWQGEIIVVDDNSPDGTAQAAREYQPRGRVQIRCLVRTRQRGLATAIRCGLEQAAGERLMVMDSDFNHDPGIIPQMFQLLDQVDLVIGSRYIKGGGMQDRTRHYLSWAYNRLIMLLLKTPVHDNLSGFFAVQRSCLVELDWDTIFQGYGEYFIRLLFAARRRGFSMREIPVFYRLRQHGSSKSDFAAMLRDYTACVLGLKRQGR